MRTLKPITLILLIQGAVLAGCVPMSPRTDAQFGDAVKQGTYRQIIDAGSGSTFRAAPGLDGAAAKATIDRYHKSFVTPQAQPDALAIGIGGVSQ